MSPAAGGAAPAQSAAAAAAVVAPAIAGQEPDRAPVRRDPPGPAEGADPANAAARKTAWGVLAPSPAAAAAAAANPAGGIIGGDASWPALVESKRGRSASSDSLKSLSDGSGPSAQEDSIAASTPPHPTVEVKPISPGSNPTSTLPPNAAATASSQQNGATTQPNPVRRSGSNGGNSGGGGGRGNGGGSGGRRAANNSGGGGSSGSGGDGHRNGGSLGSGCNSSNGDTSSGTSTNGEDSSRNSLGNNNIRGVGGRSSNNNGDVNYRNSVGGGNHWNNNSRNSNGVSNGGGGGRGGYRGRRDHDRGGNFSPRNYPRVMPYHQHQQQPGVYQQQPGTFPRPPPPPAAHLMPQHFMPYVPAFPYHGDVQSYPIYLPPVEQFQNMHLVRPPMQPSWVPQEQLNLHENIRTQIEFYFSTNNLCHDTYLRRQMNDQGWVPIDLILGFNRMRAFTGLVDTNYILDVIRGSEILEVQGNNIRRRNDWVDWLLH